MAKTLVGLYDSFSDADRVRQDLIDYGFSRSDIRLITHDPQHRDAEYTTFLAGDADYNGNLVHSLTDLGVPHDDARAYTEGVRRGGSLIVVESSDEWADDGIEILNRVNPVDINERRILWHQEGWEDREAGTAATTTATATATDVHRERAYTGQRVKGTDKDVVIPVVEEDVTVGKRAVEHGRVRIYSHVAEHPVEEQVRLREEKVKVERRPVDRPATEADLRAAEQETVEFTETVEEPVVSKRARVVEEVVVHKDVDERVETVRGTERRTEINVDREPDTHTTGAKSATSTRGFEAYADDYRRHYNTTFASNGGAYDEYEPAYRYGYDLSTNDRYRGRDWAAFEADARRDWEQRHPGTWDRFKGAIRHGWESVRSKV